ncbi:reverse transcriptase domain-containing protein, partial [Tanacetum coccineum]
VLVEQKAKIVVILCKLEKVFPESFFDIMMHLLVYLPSEAKIVGPPNINGCSLLKGYVKNKARVEGCIVERYIDNECLTFCSMYLNDVDTIFNKVERNNEMVDFGGEISVFSCKGSPFCITEECVMSGEVGDVKITIRSKLHTLTNVKKKLEETGNENCNRMFRSIVFADDLPAWFRLEVAGSECMSTRSSSSNLIPPFSDPESVIRNCRRNLSDPSLLLDFEEINMNSNNIQGPPPADPPQNHNGPPGLNLQMPAPDLRKMEVLCQPTMNGRGGPIAPSMKQNGVIDDALRLYLIPYNLTHHVTAWFDRLPKNSMHTFQEMATKFLSKYFPLSMVTKLRNDISNFQKLPDESLFEACERYKLSIDRMRKALQERPQGTLPSNIIPNPREEIKAITTLSGNVLAGHSLPSPPSSSKEVERDPETITDHVLPPLKLIRIKSSRVINI